MNKYSCLNQQIFSFEEYSLVPIRFEDRYDIMKWRNEQIYHLRQDKILTTEDQDNYFLNVVSKLYDEKKPNQILFSFLKNEKCIGYGGLVHINWVDRNAEISFIMDTQLEKDNFELNWSIYLKFIEKIGFFELDLNKIYTYAFDLRPLLYKVLENSLFLKEAELKEHCFFNGDYKSVLIHSKFNPLKIRKAKKDDTLSTFNWCNNPIVRAYSFSKDKISFKDHQNWFEEKLDNKDCIYLILELHKIPIGSVRFDKINNEAIISYLIDPNFHGKGYGKIILSKSIKFIKEVLNEEVTYISGKVNSENLPSINIFKKLDFDCEILDLSTYKFTKKL